MLNYVEFVWLGSSVSLHIAECRQVNEINPTRNLSEQTGIWKRKFTTFLFALTLNFFRGAHNREEINTKHNHSQICKMLLFTTL